MGFGWLMVGYFFVSVISLYSPLSFAMLVGYPMMIVGLWYLAPYHPQLKRTFFASFLSIPFALYYSLYAFSLLGIGSLPIFGGVLWQVMEWAYFVFSLLFMLLLLNAIASLCGELELVRFQGNALRNLLLMGIMYLFDLVARLQLPFMKGLNGYLVLLSLLLRILLIFMNLYLIFSCYRHICPEGEEVSLPESTKKRSDRKGEGHK